MFLFLSCVLRVTVISTSNYKEVQSTQNSLKLSVTKQRGTIFDCNLIPITNSNKKIIAAISPTPKAITAISNVLSGENLNNVLERLKYGKPILCELPKEIKCDGIACTTVYEHSNSKTPAIHLIGYTDADFKGITGIEKAYDDILYSDKEICFSYECDGKGDILNGISPKIINNTSVVANGVVTTIDINIQNIAESAANNLETGAIVIADAKTGKIRATVSKPYFDCKNVSSYLTKKDSPLLNRAINAYCVGSVFKPCIAIAGIENNLQNFCYNCTGSCEIIDRFFKCHKRDGHGFFDLRSALAYSCNTYFFNFAFKIGKDEIYKTASSLRFGQALKLADGIYTSKGNIPQKDTLKNIAHLANFSIGQGDLLLSPISILTLYCAIASNGTYYIPSVTEGILLDGDLEKYNFGNPTRVMSEETARMIRKYLEAVLSEGTGDSAKPKKISAAGKTATAQTGKYKNGIEICQGWFCGFFPAENPKYVVTVFSEDINRQKLSCAKIFAQIADDISGLSTF